MTEHAEILLIEDNPGDAKLSKIALQKAEINNSVMWVKDGEEAFEFLLAKGRYSDRSNSPLPKIILMDLKLPKVNGFEVFTEIRNHSATNKIPVVMVTSSDEDTDMEKAKELGIDRYIVKPMDFLTYVKLLSGVKEMLR